jgi:membrane-bound lytic murein transglycosylase F
MKTRFILLAVAFLVLCCLACRRHAQSAEAPLADLPQVKDSGELVVLTLNSSTSYFDYRGEPMGFQYELAQQFAEHLGVKLRVKVGTSAEDLVHKLLQGEGDLIAYNLPVTKAYKDSVEFCGEDIITHQVLVQRNGRGAQPLTNVTELVGKEVYVKPGRYLERLTNLDKELGGGILIHVVDEDSITAEDLITQVSNGTIPYTVCDNDLAQLNKTYYPNLDIALQVSFDQRASWAVRKSSPLLSQAATEWHRNNQTSPAFRASTKRYFETAKHTPHESILSVKDGKISHFDALFKKYAKEIDWDWRLLASLAFTESNFDTTAVSWAGAKGLMQLMPRTAYAMGVPVGQEQNAEESVKAAVKYIGMLNKSFAKVEDGTERVKFVLAAYNAGLGHVIDAMALAEKYGRNKYRWEHHVADYILLKSHEEYFNDPVCRNGYFRGTETYNFVSEILGRHEEYVKKIKK